MTRKIEFLEIRLQPFTVCTGVVEIRVKLKVNGKMFAWATTYEEDHFEDLFSHLMRDAKQAIEYEMKRKEVI